MEILQGIIGLVIFLGISYGIIKFAKSRKNPNTGGSDGGADPKTPPTKRK